ncbi:hypothetical protein BWD42_05085 [Sphingobacterium sp. CZ-UAM]|uniref:hypothetical protein n=1 Tax=Sphingobacterium sp. CZ-UAM TaxID=1933868 RepID=UPI00098493F3|nr:hypothetical protein [Sphingobacterium sp. CZ-UAM]OOG19314.1 hypothetical protein BWD42_05085 [Sphingobacterium sp. CZ-UAM]
MKKYTLDKEGVRQWLEQLYGSTIELQMMEQNLILLSLHSWLMSRFELSESQVEYLISLSSDFKNNLAQEIAFAINNRADITLDKQTNEKSTSTLSRDSVKVTEYESNKIQSDTPEIPVESEANEIFSHRLEGHLIVRIYYKLL